MAKGKKTEAAAAMRRSREMEAKTLAESHQKVAAMGGSSAIAAQSIDSTDDDSLGCRVFIIRDPAAPLDADVLKRANMTEAEKEQAVPSRWTKGVVPVHDAHDEPHP